jgi:Na+-translocating ferredoxin:NAD+ oxidoreductase RnfE subunit
METCMMTNQMFIEKLVRLVPELRRGLEEHLKDNCGELLPHVFMGDVTRWTITHANAMSHRVLNSLEGGLATGSAEVANLILASFVENLIGEGTAVKQFKDLMGAKTERCS